MKWTFLILAASLLSLACGEQKPKVENKYDFYDDVMNTRPEDSDGKDKKKDKDKKDNTETQTDSGVEESLIDPILADETIELEELEMEDSDALTALILDRLSTSSKKKATPHYSAI